MELIIKEFVIDAPISDIIKYLRKETGDYYFKSIGRDNQEHLIVTCPFHKDGQENHPSASFYNDMDNDDVPYGFFKCFTCGKKVPLWTVVGYCFGQDDEFGKNWLIENFGKLLGDQRTLKPLRQTLQKNKVILDPSVLDDYNYIHPYMYKRKLTDPVISAFKIGYDPETDSLTFPCWDVSGNLIAVNRRSVTGKTFEITSNTEKEVYLLNFIIKQRPARVFICESQINALTCWSYGIPAVAFLGTGAKNQYEILKRCDIHNYVLCLDPDPAGRIGVIKFLKGMGLTKYSHCIISIKDLPDGKDVNDLSKEEFLNSPELTVEEWCTKHNMVIT